jgi:DNA-binding MarR family transcriptional regulator
VREEEVYRLQKQVKRLYRRVQREQPVVEGLSYSALQVLVAVEQADRALRPGELAAELQMTSSNVAAALRSLEMEGLVVRQSDPADGRKALVSLTPAGAKVITEARRGKHAWLQQAIADALTPGEQRLLLRAGELLQRLAEHPASRDGAARS